MSFFLNVISQIFKCWPIKKKCWERKSTMDPVCSFMFLLGIPRTESPNHSCLGGFSGLSLYWAILRDAGTPTPKSRIASAHYQSSKSSMLRVPPPASQPSACVGFQASLPSPPPEDLGDTYNQCKHGALATALAVRNICLAPRSPLSSANIHRFVVN